jgi:chromosome partitioning protein
MRIVSVINYKGGVGKTTIVANLAAELGFRGHSVLAVDLDPQASLTFSFVSVDRWRSDYASSRTIKNWYDAFIDETTDLQLPSLIVSPSKINRIVRDRGGRVDLICSHLGLINVDLELATRLGGASPRQTRNNFLRVYSRFRQGLSTLSAESYEYILVDCPPNFNIVTRNAIIASDYYLVPAKPDYLSTLGIEQLQRHVLELITDYNNYAQVADVAQWAAVSPRMLGVLFTMISVYAGEPISTQRQYISQIRNLSVPTLATYIRENKTAYGAAPEYGVPLVVTAVSGETYENVQRELEDLATEFIGIVR